MTRPEIPNLPYCQTITSKSNYSEDKKKELFEDLKNTESSKIKVVVGNNQKLTYPPTESQNNRNVFVFNSNFISDHVYDGTKGNLKKFNVSSTELNDPEIKKITNNIEGKEEIIKGLNKKTKKAEEDFTQIKRIITQISGNILQINNYL
jgi:hypothetical protein